MTTVTVYGPYTRKDGRKITIVNGKTVSYPKWLYEQHHKVNLHPEDTVDHDDGDFTNDTIENLIVKDRGINASLNTSSSGPLGYKQSEEHKRSGEKNGMAKITQEEVDFYRQEFKAGKTSRQWIMDETGMSRRAVENFLFGRSFK